MDRFLRLINIKHNDAPALKSSKFILRVIVLAVESVQWIHLGHLLSVYSPSFPGHFQVQATCFNVL